MAQQGRGAPPDFNQRGVTRPQPITPEASHGRGAANRAALIRSAQATDFSATEGRHVWMEAEVFLGSGLGRLQAYLGRKRIESRGRRDRFAVKIRGISPERSTPVGSYLGLAQRQLLSRQYGARSAGQGLRLGLGLNGPAHRPCCCSCSVLASTELGPFLLWPMALRVSRSAHPTLFLLGGVATVERGICRHGPWSALAGGGRRFTLCSRALVRLASVPAAGAAISVSHGPWPLGRWRWVASKARRSSNLWFGWGGLVFFFQIPAFGPVLG